MGYCLVAYDIHSDALRRSMGRLLENSGVRLQRSVFVTRLSEGEKKRLETFVREKLEDGDSLLILPCCTTCLNRARLSGQEKPDPISLYI